MAEVVTMRAKDVLGQRGEQAAAEYLAAAGFRILARNWRCAEGEIDIVAVERHTLVVCEVKTRSTSQRGTPLESVSRAKRNRLRRLAIRWLTAHGVRFDQVRIDIVGVQPGPGGDLAVEHVRGVG
jgi:putative endonuclease